MKKLAANGVIMHPKGGPGGGIKVALTTSANTAVNTAHNSPKMVKQMHTGKSAASSTRRKPSASSSGHPVSIELAHGHGFSNRGQTRHEEEKRLHQNNSRQNLDESHGMMTEVAYGGPESSEKLVNMRQMEPSKLQRTKSGDKNKQSTSSLPGHRKS